MKLSSCDVTWHKVFGDRFCNSRKGGTWESGWVHPKVADSMAISGLSFRNTLVGSGWTTAMHGTLFRRESFYSGLHKRLPAESRGIASYSTTVRFKAVI